MSNNSTQSTTNQTPSLVNSGESFLHSIYDMFRFLNFLTEIPKILLVIFLIYAGYKIYKFFKSLGPELEQLGQDIENEFKRYLLWMKDGLNVDVDELKFCNDSFRENVCHWLI